MRRRAHPARHLFTHMQTQDFVVNRLLTEDLAVIHGPSNAVGVTVQEFEDNEYISLIQMSFPIGCLEDLERVAVSVKLHGVSPKRGRKLNARMGGFAAYMPETMRFVPNCEIVAHFETYDQIQTYTRPALSADWRPVAAMTRVPLPPFLPSTRYGVDTPGVA